MIEINNYKLPFYTLNTIQKGCFIGVEGKADSLLAK